jgi:D-alanine-D-alanine ligase
MYVSTNKILTKMMLEQAGLPTPTHFNSGADMKVIKGTRYIAKPLWEDASIGIDDESVLDADINAIKDFLAKHPKHHYFFEEYIDGREFNISVLGGNRGPEVLPIAEIVFQDYPDSKPKIVGYDAKWNEGSFEYSNTLRSFGLEKEDPGMAAGLKEICIRCWHLFALKGYARIDFRVDRDGKPWILEVNANPCLSDDAGFYAAATEAGYSFKELIERICEDVWN